MLKKILFWIFLSLFIFSEMTFASAKVVVPAWQNLKIHAESDILNWDYSWVLMSSDWYILLTQNWPIFNTKFKNAWKFNLNLTITDKKTWKTKFTKTQIIVWQPNKFWNDFNVKVASLPVIHDWNEIYLPWNEWKIFFSFWKSKWVKQIFLDKNIEVDEKTDRYDNVSENWDKDWNPQNDNVLWACKSFEKCKQFNVSLKKPKNANSVKIKFTFLWFSWKKEDRIFTILFNHKEKKPDWFKIKINSVPKIDKKDWEKIIFVPFWINEAIIDLSASLWDFLEYEINWKKISEWEYFVAKRWVQHEKILKIKLKSWKKIKTDKIKIIWWKKWERKDMEVFSSTNQNFVWKKIFFWVTNLDTEKYFVEWDFDWDWKIDVKNKVYTNFKFEKEWKFETKIFIKDKKTEKIFKESVLKIEIRKQTETEFFVSEPVADFDFEIKWPNVKFKNKSKVSEKLLNKRFKSFWKFWDWNVSNEKNPEFLYSEKWEYKVELIITDTAWNTSSIKKTIEIIDLNLEKNILKNKTWNVLWNDEDLINNAENTEGTEENIDDENWSVDFFADEWNNEVYVDENNKNEIKNNLDNWNPWEALQKFLLYLAILIASILWIVWIYLIIQKIKYPDMEFSEILDEERERILSWIEGEEYKHPEIKEVKKDKIEEKVENIEPEIKKIEEKKTEKVSDVKKIEDKKIEEKKPERVEKKEVKVEKKPENPFVDFWEKDEVKKSEKSENKIDNPFANFWEKSDKNVKKQDDKKTNEVKNPFVDFWKKDDSEKKSNVLNEKLNKKNSTNIWHKPQKNPFENFWIGEKNIVKPQNNWQKTQNNNWWNIVKTSQKSEKKVVKNWWTNIKKSNISPPPPPPPASVLKNDKNEDDDLPDFLK